VSSFGAVLLSEQGKKLELPSAVFPGKNAL
jgi:hypothetical protein